MTASPSPVRVRQRRRALDLGLVQGILWSIGNALSTGSLVSYLARDLGARGLALSLVLAAPNLAGVLRLAAPALIYRLGTARRACLNLSLAAYVLIAGLPLLAWWAGTIPRQTAVAAMIALLFTHQLLEYLASVALWSWWADLVPPAIRGRYFGRRQMLQLAVSIPRCWRAVTRPMPCANGFATCPIGCCWPTPFRSASGRAFCWLHWCRWR